MKCKLCQELIPEGRGGDIRIDRNIELVRVKGDLFGEYIDIIVHSYCWEELKIND